MSSLKNLREVLKQINEKKDPILNMYLGDLRHSYFMANSENDASLEILSTSGKAKVDVEVIEVLPLKKEYEISIKRLLNKEKALEVIVYNTKEKTAVSKKYKKLEDAVELKNTTVKSTDGNIDEIVSYTNTYSFDKLRLVNPHYNYEEIPVQVISAILNSSLYNYEIEPDHKDSFFADSRKIDGAISLRARVMESDNVYDDTIYPYTATINPVLFAYNEYLNGCLQPSILFSTVDEVRNK